MPISVRIGAHAVTFSGIPVRTVDLAIWAFWAIFVRIGTMLFDQNSTILVRIGTRDPLRLSGVLQGYSRKSCNLVRIHDQDCEEVFKRPGERCCSGSGLTPEDSETRTSSHLSWEIQSTEQDGARLMSLRMGGAVNSICDRLKIKIRQSKKWRLILGDF